VVRSCPAFGLSRMASHTDLTSNEGGRFIRPGLLRDGCHHATDCDKHNHNGYCWTPNRVCSFNVRQPFEIQQHRNALLSVGEPFCVSKSHGFVAKMVYRQIDLNILAQKENTSRGT
jgi:hypothetical protein